MSKISKSEVENVIPIIKYDIFFFEPRPKKQQEIKMYARFV